jgi:predicted house-cleaning noncanonical NTP pyrophosphatase (MazG superfamily)
MTNPYYEHFANIIGRGADNDNDDNDDDDDIGSTYRGVLYQRGFGGRFTDDYDEIYGLGWGTTLKNLFNFAKPLFKQGAKYLGRKAVDTAANIANDAISGENIKESVKRRITDTGEEIFAKAPEVITQLVNKRQASKIKTNKGRKRRKIGRGILQEYPGLKKLL